MSSGAGRSDPSSRSYARGGGPCPPAGAPVWRCGLAGAPPGQGGSAGGLSVRRIMGGARADTPGRCRSCRSLLPPREPADRGVAQRVGARGSDNRRFRQQRDEPNPGAPRPRQAAGPCLFLCPRGHLPTRCASVPLPVDILSPCGSGRQAVRSGRPGRRGARGGHLRPSGTASLVRIVWPRAGSQSTSRL